MNVANSVRRAWAWYYQWLFARTDVYHLGVVRAALCLNLVVMGFAGQGNNAVPLEFAEATFVFRWLSPGLEWVAHHSAAIEAIARVSLLLAGLGILCRLSLVTAMVTYSWTAALDSVLGGFPHQLAPPVVALWVLALSPGVTSFSVDSFVREAWSRRRSQRSLDRPWRSWSSAWLCPTIPAWPARLILCFVVLFYFATGWAKVWNGGVKWLDGQTLAVNLSEQIGRPAVRAYPKDLATPYPGAFFHGHAIAERDKWRDGYGLESFVYDAGATTRLGRALSKQPVIMCVLAVGTVFIELGFIVILFSRSLFKLYILPAVFFHTSITLTMGLSLHLVYWPLFLLAFDWNALLRANFSTSPVVEPG